MLYKMIFIKIGQDYCRSIRVEDLLIAVWNEHFPIFTRHPNAW